MKGYTYAQHRMFAAGGATHVLKIQDSTPYAELLSKCAQWTQENLKEDNNNNNKNDVFNTTFTNSHGLEPTVLA